MRSLLGVLSIYLLIIDDTTLDKPYAQQIALVHRHWSGKHHRVVSGINLVTLLWSDGTDAIPCDYRLYDKPTDGVTKIDVTQLPRYAVLYWYEPSQSD